MVYEVFSSVVWCSVFACSTVFQWLTLDWLRVVVISTASVPELRIDRHWWIDTYLLPPVEADVYSQC